MNVVIKKPVMLTFLPTKSQYTLLKPYPNNNITNKELYILNNFKTSRYLDIVMDPISLRSWKFNGYFTSFFLNF